MTRSNGLPSLTWVTDSGNARTRSNLGHVITASRGAARIWVYNAWAGEPHKSKHLHQDSGLTGLANCKAACERHAAQSNTSEA
jgi:hypothetical protein